MKGFHNGYKPKQTQANMQFNCSSANFVFSEFSQSRYVHRHDMSATFLKQSSRYVLHHEMSATFLKKSSRYVRHHEMSATFYTCTTYMVASNYFNAK